MRRILTAVFVCLLLFSSVQVQGQWTEKMTKAQLDELYQNMTTLSKPAWGDRDRVRKRYAYLFPKLAKACKCNEAQISKMAIIQTDFITEAGIKESYLDLYRIDGQNHHHGKYDRWPEYLRIQTMRSDGRNVRSGKDKWTNEGAGSNRSGGTAGT